jgi:hypothetical protein
MRAGRLVYQDNVSVLRWLEGKRPGAFTDRGLLDLDYAQNRVFHESAHLIADRTLPPPRGQREFILRSMISESFANTCELVGNIDVSSPAHRAFYRLNSLWGGQHSLPSLRRALASCALETMFELVFLCFVRANFLFAGLSPKTLEADYSRVFGARSVGAGELKEAMPALSRAFELSLQFRLVTTRHYLKFVGISGALQKLLGFNPIKALSERPLLGAGVQSLIASATRVRRAARKRRPTDPLTAPARSNGARTRERRRPASARKDRRASSSRRANPTR